MRTKRFFLAIALSIGILCTGAMANAQSEEWCHTFRIMLGYAQTGSSEVGYLHTALDKEGISYAPDTGNTYGTATSRAVKDFQLKYGIRGGDGYFGYFTMLKMNELYGCACATSWDCTEWSACSNNIQTRTCTDLNRCGVNTDKPAVSQTCENNCRFVKDYNTDTGINTYKATSDDCKNSFLSYCGTWTGGRVFYNNELVYTCPGQELVVTVYSATNYQGTAASYAVGSYTLTQMQAKGTANDSISSVKVAPGYKVTFYRANGFGGATLVKTANDSTFVDDKVSGTKYTNWNDEASSMKVERVEEVQPTTCNASRQCVVGGGGKSCSVDEDCAANNATIIITSPTSGAEVVTNSTQTITWTSTNVDYVKIQIVDPNGTAYDQVVNKPSSTGTFTWTVNRNFSVGTGYAVKITDQNDPNTYATVPFSIVAQPQNNCRFVGTYNEDENLGISVYQASADACTSYFATNSRCGTWTGGRVFYNNELVYTCPGSELVVTVYSKTNYQGTAASYAVGSYNLAQMQAKGTANDSISSVKVAPGYKVTFYRANGFGGVTLVKTANDSTFTDDKVTGTKYTNWDNEASSMKVERVEEQPTCVDSDGGDNPDVAGYLTFNGQKYGEDFCYTQDSGYYGYVGESFCINNGAGTSTSNPRKCDYGCENGACKPAPQTSITVTSPNGGETWVNEQTMQIRWSAQNIPSDASYTINIYNGTNTSSYNKTIISGLAYGTTSYTWTVEGNNGKNGFGLGYEKSLWQKIADLIIPTAHAAAGTDKYIIQVCAGGVCGESGIFAINLTNFVMISPNGGETFTVGQNLAINWNSGGLLSSDSLSIWLLDYKNGDIPVSTQIATGLPGDIKSYNYLIPDITPSSKFLVDIEVLRNGIMIARGLSANYFTIKEATVSCPGYLDNYVVLNSGRYSNGTVSFNLTNTTSSTQTIAISIGSGSISKSSITIPSGTCASPDSITYSSSSDTTITFTNSGRTIASFPVVATSQTSCTDTDGGKDYFTKGTVTSRTGSSTDLCYSAEGRIAEYYCSPEGYRVYEWYTCPNGCSNGACIQTQSYNNQNTLNSMAAALANIAAQLKQLLGR